MCAQQSSPGPRENPPTPEVPPPPGDLPKHFPEKTPLSDDGLEAGKREAASPIKNDGLNAEPGDELEDGGDNERPDGTA